MGWGNRTQFSSTVFLECFWYFFLDLFLIVHVWCAQTGVGVSTGVLLRPRAADPLEQSYRQFQTTQQALRTELGPLQGQYSLSPTEKALQTVSS